MLDKAPSATKGIRGIRAARIGAAVGLLMTAMIGYTQVAIDVLLGHPWGWHAGFTEPAVPVVHGIFVPTALVVAAVVIFTVKDSWVSVIVPAFMVIGVGAVSYFQWDVRQSEIVSIAQLFPAILCSAYVFQTRSAWLLWGYACTAHGLAVMLSPDVLWEAGDWAVVHTLLAGLVLIISRLRDMEGESYEALERAAETDALTGVNSRTAFEAMLTGERNVVWNTSTVKQGRGEAQTTLLVVDIDRFKSINDQWGHPAGDVALQQVALILSGVLGEQAVVCRTGGDEFAVFLPPKSPDEVEELVAKVVTAASVAGFEWERKRQPLHLSVGAATGLIGGPHGVRLYAEADASMLATKARSRKSRGSLVAKRGHEATGEAQQVCRR